MIDETLRGLKQIKDLAVLGEVFRDNAKPKTELQLGEDIKVFFHGLNTSNEFALANELIVAITGRDMEYLLAKVAEKEQKIAEEQRRKEEEQKTALDRALEKAKANQLRSEEIQAAIDEGLATDDGTPGLKEWLWEQYVKPLTELKMQAMYREKQADAMIHNVENRRDKYKGPNKQWGKAKRW